MSGLPATFETAAASDTAAWHAASVPEVAQAVGAALDTGLSSAEAARRLAIAGPNALPAARSRSPLRILASQFANLMVLVLIAAALLAGFIGEAKDTIAIVAILVLNAGLGFAQEYRAERAVAALRAMAAPQARVRRDGSWSVQDAMTLVPGDVVRLESGDVVPADLRLMEVAQLRIAESALTGESVAVEKGIAAVAESAPLGDRAGSAFKGTIVANGRGTGLVVATGSHTELGRIATLLEELEPVITPLQRRLARFTERLALAVVGICALIFVVGLLRGEAPGIMLLTAVSLAVAAIPEALPAVVTVALALGARRAAARQALIRNLPAVETLGSVTYICTDKTGTLTENRMRLMALRVVGALDQDRAGELASVPATMLDALAVSNDVDPDANGVMRGDPTEVALVEAAAAAGSVRADVAARMPRVGELPFQSERGCMTTLHATEGKVVAFTKGAPERVLAACTEGAEGAAEAAAALARSGMRVLALAVREWPALPAPLDPATVESGLRLLGLVGLQDPPRASAAAAVAECRKAGIRVVMITGDHPETAAAIAETLGIVDGVHARVAPEDKLRIVEALQAKGEFVAMTGDGVNDAPALKRADIGIAMGRGGTDVAREASDLILLDDHFATIVGAVREGRRIYDNIRKFVRYALTCNSAEIWALFLAPLVGLPIPLLPIHILWVNLVTDGLPGIALTVEPGERALMDRPPRPPSESIFARGLWQHATWVGLLMGCATLATQAFAYAQGWHWQSMTFTVLAFLQLGHLVAIRSEREPFWVGFFDNPALLSAVALTVVLQLCVLYVPALQGVFGTEALSGVELAWCALFSSVGFVAVEAEKFLIRRGLLVREAAPRSA